MERKYAKAYTEVLEILKHIPEEELNRIPKTELQFYEDNCDKNYKYDYDASIGVERQTISREASTVIVAIYMNYFANERQKSIIEEILKQNSVKEEKEKSEKYDVNKIFEKNAENVENTEEKSNDEASSENLPVEVNNKNENFIKRIINKIKSIFQK